MHTILYRFIIIIGLLSVQLTSAGAQENNPTNQSKPWRAYWITAPGIDPTGYSVCYFRKKIELKSAPDAFPVHISGDSRYKLYVNEALVSVGPARGDVFHWNYETVDLAPYLKAGSNIVASVVWNEGKDRPKANVSLQTGFILQGAASDAGILNTNQSWKVIKCEGYTPVTVDLPSTAYSLGPGERVDMRHAYQGWDEPGFDDEGWSSAEQIATGFPKNTINARWGECDGWNLVPGSLPQMELRTERLLKVRLAEGISAPDGFPSRPADLTIPANSKAKLILDRTHQTNAYLTLLFGKGRDAQITVSYADCLYEKFPFRKGHRDIIEGKEFRGRTDEILSSGADRQEYTTLFWRSYRYLQLEVETKDTPLIINDIYGTFTGYPFKLNARLDTDRDDINRMMEIGWRTARLCAFDTYFDCPQYEQLQYIGDTRIQGLVSIFNSGDDRLLRNAINQLDYSRLPEGAPLARYPASTSMLISTFPVWYIGMLHDYMMYCGDLEFIRNKLPGARQIMHFFKTFQQEDGSLKDLPGWQFTDWVKAPGWAANGVRQAGNDGCSTLLDLQLLYAYQKMIELENELGIKEMASLYQKEADILKTTIRRKYLDAGRGLFADRSEKDLFSQHANTLAILTGAANESESVAIAQKLLDDKTLAPASIYFKFYLHQALIKAGLGDGYLDWLDLWRENISMGLTTWGETSDVNSTRSDCHAWGANPNIEFFRTVLGIDSRAPGFKQVIIEPHPGTVKTIGGEIPHPAGKIKVKYNVNNKTLNAEIDLPSGISGELRWNGKSIKLVAGNNKIKL